ncbi:hypothetical protein AB0E78_33465 [Streptomyces sp. NPDC032198]|uniref:hypothetical protein n=1 Tax=Streptomyces sp. NPDC032198 TaxID=3155127 RepID=UPI0033DCC328
MTDPNPDSSPPGRTTPQRILVVGGVGAGKSTFAAQLAAVTDLPYLPLDGYRYQPDGQRRSRMDLEHIATGLAAGDRWICEGIFLTWTGSLMEAADTIVWMDPPARVAAYRVMRRWFLDRLRHRQLPYGFRKCVRLARSTLQPHDLHAVRAAAKNLNPSPAALSEATNPWREKTVRLRTRREQIAFLSRTASDPTARRP